MLTKEGITDIARITGDIPAMGTTTIGVCTGIINTEHIDMHRITVVDIIDGRISTRGGSNDHQ